MRIRTLLEAVDLYYRMKSLHQRGNSRWLGTSTWVEYLRAQYIVRHPEAETMAVKDWPNGFFKDFVKLDGPSRKGNYVNSLHMFAVKLEWKRRWRGTKMAKAIRRFVRVAKAHPDYRAILKWAKEHNDPKNWTPVKDGVSHFNPVGEAE